MKLSELDEMKRLKDEYINIKTWVGRYEKDYVTYAYWASHGTNGPGLSDGLKDKIKGLVISEMKIRLEVITTKLAMIGVTEFDA